MNSKYEVKKLGDYIVQVRGISYKPTDISEEPIDTHMAVLRANSIKNNKLILEDLIYVNKDLVKENQIIKENDILIAASSGSKEIVGKSVQIKDNTNFTFGAFCKIVRCSEKIEPRYVGYFLRTPYYRSTISNLVCGANINNLKNEHIDELLIPMPSREIQQKIVNILDKSQELIDKRKEQIEALDELVKSQFIEMFGDPILNKKGWEVKRLGEVCEMKAGKNIKAADIYPENIGELYPCYGGNGLRGYVKEYSHDGNIPLIGRQGALCGNVKYAQGKFYATEHAVVTQPKIEMNSYWLYFILEQLDLNRLSTGAAQPGLTVGKLNEVELPISPIELQNKFEEFALQVDKLKFEMEKSLKELEDNFNSLMQKAFKGELFD